MSNEYDGEDLDDKVYWDSKNIIPIYGGYELMKMDQYLSDELKATAGCKTYYAVNGLYHGLASIKAVYLLASILDNL